MVLTHGWAQAGTCRHHQVDHLGQRVVTRDLRGHGRSGRAVAESCTVVVADDLASVVNAAAPVTSAWWGTRWVAGH